MKKRIISLALCFLLVFSHVLPVAAVDSSEPACSGSCEDTTSAATHTADCAVYAYYESMSAKGAQHMYENWDAISESDRANLLIWLDAHNPDMAAELRALLTPAAEESTPTETTVPAEPQPAVEEKTLESGEFSVTGKDIPEGAELIIGEFPMPYSADTPAVSMYNIKVYDGDEVWQPANGETVEVSIPVSNSDAETVNVVHFMEDPDKIRYALDAGVAYAFDVSGDEDLQVIFADSISGYQTATNTDDLFVVIEVFEDVKVKNGIAVVDANGFSIFQLVKGEYKDVSQTAFQDLPETVYVRPGEWVTLFSWLGTYRENDTDGIILDDTKQSINLIIIAYSYFQVDPNAEENEEFSYTLVYWDNGIKSHTVTFKVTAEYFEYDKTMIEVLPNGYAGFPAEPAVTTDTNFHYYQESGDLTASTATAAVYTTNPSDLIDITALKASSAYQENADGTAYGIADTTGVATKAVLTDAFATLEADIFADYFRYNTTLIPNNYKLVVYVVKYEATGENIGWHIGCKVVLKDSFTLNYDYNVPAGFSAFDIGDVVKPDSQSIATNGSATVTATVAKNIKITKSGNETVRTETTDPMVLTTTDPDDNNKEITATFVGWNTDPNAVYGTTTTGWYSAGDNITLTSDTTLYAIWTTTKKYTKADVTFRKLVADESGATVEDSTPFNFTATGFNGVNYQLYTAAGAPKSNDRVDSDSWNFTLSNGESIVFYSVSESNTNYTIEENDIPTGYVAKNGATTTIAINDTTNTSGKFNYDFINVKDTKYTITYHTNYDPDAVTTQTKEYGTAVNLNAALSRTGYTFVEWNTAADGSGTSYAAGYSYSVEADLTLYAQWTPTNYTITYNGLDGAIVSGNPATYTIESDAITLNNPTKEGYTFDGWSGTDITGLSKSVTIPAGSIGDRTYTANWTRITYPVTYNTNGGTGTFEAQTKEYGIALTLHSDVPVKEGYSFSGWFGSDGNTYEAGASYTLNAALTLTAQWKAIVADLKIKTVLNASEPYADQNFVFIVTGDPDDKNIDTITIEVALDGNNEVVIGNMPAGTYTVTEKGNWTWRYNGIQSREAIVDSDGDTVTFTFGEPDTKLWLSGYHYGKK